MCVTLRNFPSACLQRAYRTRPTSTAETQTTDHKQSPFFHNSSVSASPSSHFSIVSPTTPTDRATDRDHGIDIHRRGDT